MIVSFVVVAYGLQSSRQLHYALPCVPFLVSIAAMSSRSAFLSVAVRLLPLIPLALVVLAGIAGFSPIGLLALVSALFLGGFALALARVRPLPASLLLAGLWSFVFGVWSPLFVPRTWPSSLEATAQQERVLMFGGDVGVGRLESGLDLHRSPRPVAEAAPGELWVHRHDEHPGGPHLAQWSRLRQRVDGKDILEVVRCGSVMPLTELWDLSRLR